MANKPLPLPLMTGEEGIKNRRYSVLNSSYPDATAFVHDIESFQIWYQTAFLTFDGIILSLFQFYFITHTFQLGNMFFCYHLLYDVTSSHWYGDTILSSYHFWTIRYLFSLCTIPFTKIRYLFSPAIIILISALLLTFLRFFPIPWFARRKIRRYFAEI